MADQLIDGNFLQAQTVGARRFEYPFRQNADRVSALFEEDYWQTKDTWTPQEFVTPHPELRDFYLIGETEPVEFMAGLVKFTRRYSRVPQRQIIPGSMFVTKPLLSGNFPQNIGSSIVIQPEPNVGTYQFYAATNITVDSGPPFSIAVTGGNFSITIGGNTAAGIGYSPTAGSLAAALNALPIVQAHGNANVPTASSGGASILFDNPWGAITIDTTGITGGGPFSNICTPRDAVNRVWDVTISGSNLANGALAGTFTMNVLGQVTAPIAVNGATTAFQSALVALDYAGPNSSIGLPASGGLYSGKPLLASNIQAKFSIILGLPTFSLDTTNLLPANSGSSISYGAYAGWTYAVSASPQAERTITAPGHGAANTDTLLIMSGNTAYTVNAGNFAAVSSTQITLNSLAGGAFSTSSALTRVGRLTANYTGGGTAILTRVKKVTDFYLPGVTPGVTNIDTVPLPASQGDDSSLLSAIFSGATSINYEVGDLTQWRESPILARTIITLNPNTL